MPQFRVNAPDGSVYDVTAPDGATEADAIAYIQGEIAAGRAPPPAAAPPSAGDRDDTNIFRDIPGSLVAGIGQLVQFPAQVYGLATGDFDTALGRAGAGIERFGDDIKSPGLRVREDEAAQRIEAAGDQGMLAEIGTAAGEYLTDPRLLLSGVVQAAPSLVGTLGAGAIAQKGVQFAGRRAATEAAQAAVRAKATKVGMASAIAAGAGQQAASVGADAYVRVMELPDEAFETNAQYRDLVASGTDPEAARETVALGAAREAAAIAGAVSVGTAALLPGAEKLAFGKRLGATRVGSAVTGAVGEGAQEFLEEGGGRLAENVGVGGVDPNTELLRGVAGQATVGLAIGSPLGGGVGAIAGPDRAAVAPAAPEVAAAATAAPAQQRAVRPGPAAAPVPEAVATGLGKPGSVVAIREAGRDGKERLVNYGYEGEQDGFVMLRGEGGDLILADPAELDGRLMKPVDPPKGALLTPLAPPTDPDDPGAGADPERNSFIADAEAERLAPPVPGAAPNPMGLGGPERAPRPLTPAQTAIEEQRTRTERLVSSAKQARLLFNAGSPSARDEADIEAMEQIAADAQLMLDGLITAQRRDQSTALNSAPDAVNLGALDKGAKRVRTGDIPAGDRPLVQTPLERAAEAVPTGDVPAGTRAVGQAGMTPLEIAMQGRPAGEPQAAELRPLGVPPGDVTVQKPIQKTLAGAKPAPSQPGAPGEPKPAAADRGYDVLTFVKKLGGVRDDAGHALTSSKRGKTMTGSKRKGAQGGGRDWQRARPGLVNNKVGLSIDEVGEALWQEGYFGPPAITPRPSTDQVLELMDRAVAGGKAGKVYRPENDSTDTDPTVSAEGREAFDPDAMGATEAQYRALARQAAAVGVEAGSNEAYDELNVRFVERLAELDVMDFAEAMALEDEIDRVAGPNGAAIAAEKAQEGDFNDDWTDPGYVAELEAAARAGDAAPPGDEGVASGPAPVGRGPDADAPSGRDAGRLEQADRDAGQVGGETIDADYLRSNFTTKAGFDMGAASRAVEEDVLAAQSRGDTVTYTVGAKSIPLVDGMKDASGQRWGLMAIAMPQPGEAAAITITPRPVGDTAAGSLNLFADDKNAPPPETGLKAAAPQKGPGDLALFDTQAQKQTDLVDAVKAAPEPSISDNTPARAPFDAILADAAQRKKLAAELSASGADVRLAHKDGRFALAGKDVSKPGGFRLTRFDADGPVGHTEHGSLNDAVLEGLRNNYYPAAAPEVTEAVTPAAPAKVADQARRILGLLGFTADEIGAMDSDDINEALRTADIYARDVEVIDELPSGDAVYVSIGETSAMYTLWRRSAPKGRIPVQFDYMRNLSTDKAEALKLAKIVAGRSGFKAVYTKAPEEARKIERKARPGGTPVEKPAIPAGVALPEGLVPGTAATVTAEPTSDPAPEPEKPLTEMSDNELLTHFGLTVFEGTSNRTGKPYWQFRGDLERNREVLDRAGASAPSTWSGRTSRAVFNESAYKEVVNSLRGDIPVEGAEPDITPAEAAKVLKANKLTVFNVGSEWFVEGNTYENRFVLRKSGGNFVTRGSGRKALKAYTYSSDPTLAIAAALTADGKAGGPDPDAGDGPGTGGALAKPARIDALREREDAAADTKPDGQDAVSLVSAGTKDLIERGLKFNIPQEVVDDQIEDIGRMAWAYGNDRPMFMLSNAAGTGKTFVLGGAIRELRAAGAKRFIYVTMNEDLIAQIKRDLGDYGVDDVDFYTYSKLSDAKTEVDTEGSVLIFDEAHNIKNLFDGSKRALKAKELIARARFSVFASATPYENPVQAQYLEATGVFDEVGGFEEWAWAYGAERRAKEVPNPYRRGETMRIEYMAWPKRAPKADGIAARAWLDKRGMLTQRAMKIDPGMVDVSFNRAPVDPAYVELYDKVVEAYNAAMGIDVGEEVDAATGSTIKRHREGMLKRILEAAKAPAAIDRAKRLLAKGDVKSVVIFVETKAERHVGRFRKTQTIFKDDNTLYTYPEIKAMMDGWREMAAAYRARGMGSEVPPAPFTGDIEAIAKAMYERGIDYQLPAVPDLIKEAFGKDKVAEYTGAVTPKKAAQFKTDFLAGKYPVIVATMAKGGTGLSLHDVIGDRPTAQININLPWVASAVDQVSARVARYGLASKARIEWLFASNIPWETRVLAPKVGKRMADMGAVVSGMDVKAANVLLDDFDFEGDVDVKQLQGVSEDAVDILADEPAAATEVSDADRAALQGIGLSDATIDAMTAEEVAQVVGAAAPPAPVPTPAGLSVVSSRAKRDPDGGMTHIAKLSDGTEVAFFRDTQQFGTPVWNIDPGSIGVPISGGWEAPSTNIGFTREEALQNLPAKVEQLRSAARAARQKKLDALAIEDEVVHDNLTAADERALAEAYRQPSYNDIAKSRFVNDFVAVVTDTAADVGKAVTRIAKRIAKAVLAIAVVWNASQLSPPNDILLSQAQAAMLERAPTVALDTFAASQMSETAQQVFKWQAPIAKRNGVGMIIADKPNGMSHYFGRDGRYIGSTTTLYGRASGDSLSAARVATTNYWTPEGVSNIAPDDRRTPAGSFTAREVMNTNAGLPMLRVEDRSGENYGVAIHQNWVQTPERTAALANYDASDNKVTAGCIVTSPQFYESVIRPNQRDLNGALVLVMPDNVAATEAMFKPGAAGSGGTQQDDSAPDQPADRKEREARGRAANRRRGPRSASALRKAGEADAKADEAFYDARAVVQEKNRGCD